LWTHGAPVVLALLLALPVPASIAQSVPVLGYVAAKNADPKRLEAFRQGLTEHGYVEGCTNRLSRGRPGWRTL